jgi:hypothetical protein
MELNFVSEHGYSLFYASSGMLVFGAAVINANIKIIIYTNTVNFMTVFLVFGGILSYIGSYAFVSKFFDTMDTYNTFEHQYELFDFWLITIIIIGITSLIEISINRWNWYKLEEESEEVK